MGIETKYEYKYYTVIVTEQWRSGNEEWFEGPGHELDARKAIEFINNKLKNSENKSVNNYSVDYAQYCNNIENWRRVVERNKERPVFVQFQDNQEIKLTGEGSLYVLYEEEDDGGETSVCLFNGPDIVAQMDSGVDGLAGAGGRI